MANRTNYRLDLLFLFLFPVLLLPQGCGKETPPTRPPDPVPARIVISPPSGTLTASGQTLQLNADVLDAEGNRLPGHAINWSSTSTTVASVDRTGLVTARSDGTTMIVAAWSEIRTSITVRVVRSPSQIVVTPESLRLTSIGETATLTAIIEDAGGAEIPDAPRVWASDDPAVASVDEQGVVTAHMHGTTRITVTSDTVSSSVEVSVIGITTDRELLIDFYNATDGPNWEDNAGWLTDRPLDQWHGITVDSAGNVVSIWLNRNGLKGHIPATLGNLTHLEVLGLVHNELGGEIPSELGNLREMRRLLLQVNQLSGSIPPSLGDLTKLVVMDLHYNRLAGEIPTTFGKLANLVYLHLGNNFINGPIPPSIGQLDKLERVYFGQNRLVGEIPSEVGGLTSLIEIWMQGNLLTGEVPGELGSLKHLISLDLRDNAGLQGPLPRTFLERDLVFLHLFGTQVCIPRDPEFQEWRRTFHSIYALNCEAEP